MTGDTNEIERRLEELRMKTSEGWKSYRTDLEQRAASYKNEVREGLVRKANQSIDESETARQKGDMYTAQFSQFMAEGYLKMLKQLD